MPFSQALRCIASDRTELSAFYPFVRGHSTFRNFAPLRKLSKNSAFSSKTGTIVNKSVYGMVTQASCFCFEEAVVKVINVHKDTLDFLDGVEFLFAQQDMEMTTAQKSALMSALDSEWQKFASRISRRMQKEASRHLQVSLLFENQTTNRVPCSEAVR